MRKVIVVFAVALCAASIAEAQVDTSIVPYEGRTQWAPGVRGIPARPTVCATVSAATYGNGASEASAGIQAAIAACPTGQTVKLSAGTFLMNNHVVLNKGITLRGEGPGVTKLMKTNGARLLVDSVAEAEPIIVVGPNRWPGHDASTARDLATDALKGSMSVTLTNANGFEAGQFVLLDEDDYNNASWMAMPARLGGTSATIWASDRVVFQRHNPSAGWVDDPFPASLSWFSRSGRPLNEIKEIASVDGNIITFTTPIHTSYPRSKQAQLTRYTGANVHVRGAGIEDLMVSGGSDGNIRFETAAYSWMKNVENTVWLGEGVAVNNSFRIEVRDSYIHHGAWPQPGGAGYAISFAWGSSEVLVENNAVLNVNKVIVVRSSGAGSVVGYNYMQNGYILTTPDWQEVGLNASHMVGGHHVLFEGNESFNYDSDNTHGNAIAMTVFRNHLTGYRRDFTGMANARGAGLMFGSWWHTFIGNVIGDAGRMTGWSYEDPGTGASGGNRWTSGSVIWKLGYDPTNWDQLPDPKVLSTATRDGNFDFVTNQVQWDRGAQALPASLYLSGKPAFFGNNPWPWVDPTGALKLGVLPAKLRVEGGGQAVPNSPSNLRLNRGQ